MQPLTALRKRSESIPCDPAPSRWSYRYQRLILTPGVRLMFRVGMPFLLALGAAGFYFSDETRRDRIAASVAEARNSVETRPEFMVQLMAVDGAGYKVAGEIREVVPISFPVSSFDLDLKEIRKTISDLDPVREATVRIRPGGVLQVDVIERMPAVMWRTREGLQVLDDAGVLVTQAASRSEYADLPLIAGENADAHVEEAMRLFRAAQPLAGRLRGLVRVGERRWDVVLDRDQRILLPENAPVQALERVIALSEAQDILERDLAAVDMRIAARPTLRMNKAAVSEWWRIRQLSNDGLSQ
ncbi:Cell division protein FtsQ (plasmid) [Pseudoseohaeicola sp. NH-UV-7]|uniref:cell division protein FtsQ/DivIB n=1 Tax=unclassified Sulfitobacter TaxID=196795 RepID=UPI000E0B78DA|nr:cell division protein FtsQ/DivIB [Sulfitobacter sp. JL08]AXI55409.1 cell division protein FtsQ [Sulfitobacter sp. JL08]